MQDRNLHVSRPTSRRHLVGYLWCWDLDSQKQFSRRLIRKHLSKLNHWHWTETFFFNFEFPVNSFLELVLVLTQARVFLKINLEHFLKNKK